MRRRKNVSFSFVSAPLPRFCDALVRGTARRRGTRKPGDASFLLSRGLHSLRSCKSKFSTSVVVQNRCSPSLLQQTTAIWLHGKQKELTLAARVLMLTALAITSFVITSSFTGTSSAIAVSIRHFVGVVKLRMRSRNQAYTSIWRVTGGNSSRLFCVVSRQILTFHSSLL